ncbi:hypothetical protein ACWOYR_003847 [Vibrio parahaemolyticus]|nr:hypothetical protein [Vibrio parahaemolyticus]
MDDFLFWAAGARGWSMECRDIEMRDLNEKADEHYHNVFSRHQERRAYWKSVIEDSPSIHDVDESEQSS